VDEQGKKRRLNSIRVVILTLEEMAPGLPSMPDEADVSLALLCLNHLEKHLKTEGDNR
jgi:hypothetical protein